MPAKSLESFEQQRVRIVDQIASLGERCPGSVIPTTGRCGKPNCHCHQPNGPGHGPDPRRTYKGSGKTVTQSLPDPESIQKAEREIAEFRKLQGLHEGLIDVNSLIAKFAHRRRSRCCRRKKRRTRSKSVNETMRRQCFRRPARCRNLVVIRPLSKIVIVSR